MTDKELSINQKSLAFVIALLTIISIIASAAIAYAITNETVKELSKEVQNGNHD